MFTGSQNYSNSTRQKVIRVCKTSVFMIGLKRNARDRTMFLGHHSADPEWCLLEASLREQGAAMAPFNLTLRLRSMVCAPVYIANNLGHGMKNTLLLLLVC